MLALLLDTDLSSTQRDYAQTAQACGKALITIINEVLDRAKIEAGKLELEAVPFDLRAILDDVLSLFSEKSRRKGIEVKLIVFVTGSLFSTVSGVIVLHDNLQCTNWIPLFALLSSYYPLCRSVMNNVHLLGSTVSSLCL